MVFVLIGSEVVIMMENLLVRAGGMCYTLNKETLIQTHLQICHANSRARVAGVFTTRVQTLGHALRLGKLRSTSA